jgi:hypothetical protein
MHIEHPHQLAAEEAIRRIDAALEDLLRRDPPGGVTVSKAEKHWTGNRMDFSVAAGRGFLSAAMKGTVLVTPDHVIVDTALPALVRSFVGESRVEQELRQELDRLLAPTA